MIFGHGPRQSWWGSLVIDLKSIVNGFCSGASGSGIIGVSVL